jgi:chitinase
MHQSTSHWYLMRLPSRLAFRLLVSAAAAVGCGSSDHGGAGTPVVNPPPAPGNDGGPPRPPADAGDGSANANGAGDGATPGRETGAAVRDAGVPGGLWVMGYYSSWNSSSLPVDQIDWGALTHIATAFNVPDGNGGVDGPDSLDPALALSVVSAAHAAGKKAIASIGGAGSAQAFEGSTSQANLSTFVGNLEGLVTAVGYDGLDLDWEGGPQSDQPLLMSLVLALRSAMPGILITMPVPVEDNNLDNDLSFYGTIAPLVDQINIMSYNVSSAYSGWKSWHSSPLRWNGDDSTPVGIDITVQGYLLANVPASKLGVGSGFFGECYSAPVTAPDQTLAGSTVVATDGVMSFAHLMSAYYSPGARQWDSTAMVPYLSFASAQGPEGCTFISYEDPQSIAAKAAWVKANNLGGTILWTINEGYIASAPPGQRHPLLEAVAAGYLQ